MSDVIIASNQADAEAAEKVVAHHTEMLGKLGLLVSRLESATTSEDATRARDDVVAWARGELIPHAVAEEEALYAAAATLPEMKVLVESMIAEHKVLIGLVDDIEKATHPVAAIAATGGLRTLLTAHVDKENNLVVPALVASPNHSVADLLQQMHAALPTPEAHGAEEAHAHSCNCGEEDGADFPLLDATAIPHAIRHATIFGALDGVKKGGGVILRAPHDPLPLLAQLEGRDPGAFEISYLVKGPEVWDLQLVRR